jgi:hypothetical protein
MFSEWSQMTEDQAWEEYEALPADEKAEYVSFEDYLGSNGQCVCEGCDEVVEYDEVDEMGYCLEKCSTEEESEEDEDEDED